jgi:hypothetical protein
MKGTQHLRTYTRVRVYTNPALEQLVRTNTATGQVLFMMELPAETRASKDYK